VIGIVPVVKRLAYIGKAQVLECPGCLEQIPVYRGQERNPELFAQVIERVEDEHRVCSTFRNVGEARRARRAMKSARRSTRP
jgi:hypothetical protein